MTPRPAAAHTPPAASGRPGAEAVAVKGWLGAHRWLLLRRASQGGILALFLAGPLLGIWVVKGNLAASLTLDTLPLTDLYLLAQTLAAGLRPGREALLGAAIVLAAYLLAGGRVFCSWVCPMNPVTDAAAWLRRRLGLKGGRAPHAATRVWLLGLTLLMAALTGTLAWEWVNPVSMLQRGLLFGFGLAWGVVLAVFVYDLLIAPRGWCGHLCPQGAAYALLAGKGLIQVSASGRSRCNDCMDCFAVCPEPQVIRPALKRAGQDHPLILARDCTHCGRCIDVCSQDVFRFTTRFDRSET